MGKTTKTKRRAPGEGSIYQRSSDKLWVGVMDIPTVDGSRKQKRVYSATYEGVRNKLDQLKDDIRDGVITSPTMTLGKWLTYWLTEIKGPHVKPNTRQFYEEAIRLHITPAIGRRRLDQLTAQDIRRMLGTIATSRNKQRAHQVMMLALKAAVKDGEIRRNVCEAVEKPPHRPTTRAAFTPEQAKTIIRTAIRIEEQRDPATEPALATRWATAFLAGARKAEVTGLEWDRVDLDRGLFDFAWQLQQLTRVHGCGAPDADGIHPCEVNRPKRLRAAYCPKARWDFEDGFEHRDCYKSLLWTSPKTAAGTRVVPIEPGLLEMLRVHAANTAGQPNPHNLVWHWPDGRPISPTDDHKLWQQLLIAAGVTVKGKPIPLHSARHSTATMLQERGVSEEVRMKIMGQSSVAAHREYIHVDQTQTRAALSHLSGLLSGDDDSGA